MRKYILLGLAVVLSVSMFAQEAVVDSVKKESPWKCHGIVGLNASATGLMNWSAGGKNNVSGVVFGKVRLLYSGKVDWESNLDIEYGMSYTDQKYDKFKKSSDHLKFDTKLGWEFHKSWLLTLSAAFETQMGYGFNYTGTEQPNELISNILAPSYTDINVGIDWKPNSIFSVYLSPVGGRITTAYVSQKVQDEFDEKFYEGYDIRTQLQEKNGTWHYAKETNEKIYTNARAELGLNFKGTINYQYKDLKLITTLTLFTPYQWDKTRMYAWEDGVIYTQAQMEKNGYAIEDAFDLGWRDNNRRFGNFDVDWTFALSYQFLKCLNVTLSTNLKYINGLKIDKFDENGDVESSTERVQLQGVLGLGIGYSF